MAKETVPRLDFTRAGIASGLLAAALLAAPAFAQPEASVQAPASGARSQVVVGIIEAPGGSQRGVIAPLLRAELSALGLTLIESDPGPELGRWAEAEARRPQALMAVLLDTRGAQGWRLVIIDATRDRAIARELSGGIEQNAASVEAVVSIVVSAANALREGLEVASTPIQAVVGEPAPPPSPPVLARVAPTPDRSAPAEPAGTFVHGGVGAGVSSLSNEALAAGGVTAAVALSLRSALELRVGAARYWPARIAGPLGSFQVQRSFLGLSAGPCLELGQLLLTPEAGVIAEWLDRFDASPAPGVTAQGERTTVRVGGLLALNARHPIVGPLALELRVGAAYFGQTLEFVAETGGERELATIWPVALLGQVGLDVRTQ